MIDPFALDIFPDRMSRPYDQFADRIQKALIKVNKVLAHFIQNLANRNTTRLGFLPAFGAKFSFVFVSAVFTGRLHIEFG